MSDKYILITGASRGIGRALALRFAAGGYHIFLNARTESPALTSVLEEILSMPGGSADLAVCDISDPTAVGEMFSHIYSVCPALDVLINNAGIAHMGLLMDMTDDEWNRVLGTDLSGAFYCCRRAIPPMVQRQKGRILNISSMWGASGASCEAAYSAAKAGLNGLTKALAKELAPSQLSVNALACGVVDTDMNRMLSDEDLAALADEIPMGRFASPEEIAELAWSVVHAPVYMTGQIIGIDGAFL